MYANQFVIDEQVEVDVCAMLTANEDSSSEKGRFRFTGI